MLLPIVIVLIAKQRSIETFELQFFPKNPSDRGPLSTWSTEARISRIQARADFHLRSQEIFAQLFWMPRIT